MRRKCKKRVRNMEGFDVSAFIEQQIQAIRDILGENKAIVAVSGGVDSTVSAVITHKAIGDNLVCVFIDDNFMRLGEAEQVKNLLTGGSLNLPLRILNERQRFMEALDGLSDAEEKRKAFRDGVAISLKSLRESFMLQRESVIAAMKNGSTETSSGPAR